MSCDICDKDMCSCAEEQWSKTGDYLDRYCGVSSQLTEEEEFINKKVDIVRQQLPDVDIRLTYKINQGNYVGKVKSNTYTINLDGSIPIRIGSSHELNHIVWGTMDNLVDDGLAVIAHDATLKALKHNEELVNSYLDLKISNMSQMYGTPSPSVRTTYGDRLREDVRVKVFNVIEHAHNIIEDIRTESCDGNLYRGRANDYNDLCKFMGFKYKDKNESSNPAVSLLMYRFKRPDRVNTNVISVKSVTDIYNSSLLTSNKAGLKITQDFANAELGTYINKCVEGYLLNQIGSITEEGHMDESRSKESNIKDKLSDIDRMRGALNDRLDDIKHNGNGSAEEQKEIDDINKRLQDLAKEYDNLMKDLEDLDDERCSIRDKINGFDDAKFSPNNDMETSNGEERYTPKGNDDAEINQITSTIEREKAGDAIRRIGRLDPNKVQDKVAKISNINMKREQTRTKRKIEAMRVKMSPEVNIEKIQVRNEQRVELNEGIINAAKRNIIKIKQQEKDSLEEEGYDLLVDEFISGIRNNNLNVFRNKKQTEGTSFIISIDGSGSMSSGGIKDRITMCRNMVASLFRATKGLKAVSIYGLMWGGSCSNSKVGIKEIKSEADCKYINTYHSFGLTPTSEAIRQTRLLAKRTKHKNKIVLFLTDGHPARRDSLGKDVSDTVLREDTEREMKQLLNAKHTSTTVFLMETHISDELRNAFGGDKICVDITDMEDMKNFINRKFLRVVEGKIRKK